MKWSSGTVGVRIYIKMKCNKIWFNNISPKIFNIIVYFSLYIITCSNVSIRPCSKDKNINATNGDEHIVIQIAWDVKKSKRLAALLSSAKCADV